jgi:preprotein translocase subunit SecG
LSKKATVEAAMSKMRPPHGATIRPVYTLLAILQSIIAFIVIFLVLLHSGKDAGLSGAFGIGGGGSSFGGGSMVERNLDRATIFFSVLFVVNTIVLLKL